MPRETIKQVLIRRDNMTSAEAEDLIVQAHRTYARYLDCGDLSSASDICTEFFGLEPDYLDEFF